MSKLSVRLRGSLWAGLLLTAAMSLAACSQPLATPTPAPTADVMPVRAPGVGEGRLCGVVGSIGSVSGITDTVLQLKTVVPVQLGSQTTATTPDAGLIFIPKTLLTAFPEDLKSSYVGRSVCATGLLLQTYNSAKGLGVTVITHSDLVVVAVIPVVATKVASVLPIQKKATAVPISVSITNPDCSLEVFSQRARYSATIRNTGRQQLDRLSVTVNFYSDTGALITSSSGHMSPLPSGANADIQLLGPTIWTDATRYILLRRCELSLEGSSRTYSTNWNNGMFGAFEGRVPIQ